MMFLAKNAKKTKCLFSVIYKVGFASFLPCEILNFVQGNAFSILFHRVNLCESEKNYLE